MSQLHDILYPECHLDSPIVTGKLIQMLDYSRLPHNQPINDQVIKHNIRCNIKRNLRTPLITTQQQFRQKIEESGFNIQIINHIPYPYGNKELFNITDSEICSKLQSIFKIANSCYSKISHRLVDLKYYVEKELGLGSDMLGNQQNKQHTNQSIINLQNIFEGSRWYKGFLFWFTIKTDMREIIKQSSKQSSKNVSTVVIHDLTHHYIAMNRNIVLIHNKKGNKTHYLTFEMVLMFCDVLEGRMMIDIAMTADIRFTDFKSHGYALWDFIDSLFVDLGNQTYNIVAMIEPLTLGFLQLNDQSELLRGAFLKYALEELINEFKESGYTDDEEISLILNAVTKIFSLDDIHMTAEFFSFFRTFGHPTLEAEEAAKKVREHMNKPKIVGFQALMKGHALFCGTIINGFREQHGGSWPPLMLPEHASRAIKTCQYNNESLTDEICINHWKSFVGLRFKCFMPLKLDDDLTMFMKDKALAAIKSEWDSVYPKESMIYNPPAQTTSRRLVETFLSDSEFDPINLINYVIKGDYLLDNEFNISYSLKEKEIKRVGRLFAKMTYKMRACQVVAESLIANGVGKYFKENGMSKDEHELLKTLHKLSLSSVPKDNKINNRSELVGRVKANSAPLIRGKESDQDTRVEDNKRKNELLKGTIQYETMSTFLTTDLQKFCLNWRQETTSIFAERLNEIYGLPGFFNWMHNILEKSVLYVADPYCPPNLTCHKSLDDVSNEHIFIKYPMGGIEGYCQKLWTIITIPFLFLSAYEVGTKIAAVVQGDNQAIAITKRVHPNLPFKVKKLKCTELAQKYFNQLRHNLSLMGHNLKANETIISSNFFVYSKRIYYDGLVLSQSLKPISRVVFWSETIVDETRSACSNISTALSKSIEQGFSRWIAYAINTMKVLQQLIISLKYSINPSMTGDIVNPLIRNQSWLICAALIPSQLGGFNYMNICRLYVRNIGDPVTASLADIKRMIKVRLLPESIIQKILHQTPGDSNYLDWASDPYSLNIPNSQSVTVMLKNVTARTILSNSANPMLQGLFHFDFEQEDRDLAQFLLDRPIILPRAAHEIMDNTLTGARQELAGMLDTTKGLIRNSIRMGGVRPRMIDRLSMYDYEQFRIFNNLMRVNKNDPLIDSSACSVQLAIYLRKRMWSHLTAGRPIYGLEVPDNIEVVHGYFVEDCEDCVYCAGGSKEYGWFFVPQQCELDSVTHESNKMRVPYFGSTTDERSDIKLSHVRSPSRALRAAVRIAMVYTWAFGDSEKTWEEAWYLASFRANLTPNELKAITPISTSNNIAHRLRDRSTQMKYSGSALNRVSRYTVISNDNLNFVIDGKKVDTNLVYQQIMLLGLSILEDKFRFLKDTGEMNTLLHLHINTSCCITEMCDHPFIDTDRILPQLQLVEGNKLIYDDAPILDYEQTKIHNQVYLSNMLDFPTWSLDDLYVGLSQSLSSTIIEIITKENRDHLNEFKVLSLEDDINSLITEFLLVDPDQFTLYLGLYVSINWSYDIYYRRPEGKYQMIEYLQTVLISSPRSHFNILMNAFSHPVVFKRFWDAGLVEPVYGPNLLNQDFYKIVIDYITLAYHNYINYWLEGDTLDYIITESEEEIVQQRFEITQSRHLCFLCSLYLQRSEMPIIRGLTAIEKCTLLTDKLNSEKVLQGRYLDWNLELLSITVYPSSMTYIRRGTIKHIRLRNLLSAEAFGYDKLLASQSQPRLFSMPKLINNPDALESHYFPITALLSDDLNEFRFKVGPVKNKNRWESHILRRIGLNSTSCYKAFELITFIQDKISISGDRLFLGEGSGSMMATYYLLLGKAKNYFNTGVLSSDTLGQRVLSVIPSEYALVSKNNPDNNDMMKDLHVLFNGKPESTWIGNMSTFKYIMNTVPHNSCSMIHSDMESSSEKDPYTIYKEQIHTICLASNLGDENSVFIMKIAPQFGDYILQIIHILQKIYTDLFCFIPSFSNPYSSEVYLVMHRKVQRTLIYPYMYLDGKTDTSKWESAQISESIINYKLKKNLDYNVRKNYTNTYEQSNLTTLLPVEKQLMTYGFRLNGPKNIKLLTGHDVATGSDNLKSAITLQLNNMLNLFDSAREKVPFFDPYPLMEDSQIKEGFHLLARKIIMYYILYSGTQLTHIKTKMINNLRRKSLFVDLRSEVTHNLIPQYLLKRLDRLDIKKVWSISLETKEVKQWWKVTGYSFLLD